MKRKHLTQLPIMAIECKCGEVGFGNRSWLEEKGWDVDNSKCEKCKTVKNFSGKIELLDNEFIRP